MKLLTKLIFLLTLISLLLTGCELPDDLLPQDPDDKDPPIVNADLDNLPPFDGETAYVTINDNKPYFEESEIVTESYEYYSPLDKLGRCGITRACIGRDIMPTEDRGSISSVKPTGWIQANYSIVNGGVLYNRCHLIGFQLTGENANRENLITGTRFMNEEMIPFESMVADYIKATGNHVMYRVTPIFEGDNLVASGVLMEAYSVEDAGDGIEFCVYLYNNQPGIEIDYATGKSWLSGNAPEEGDGDEGNGDEGGEQEEYTYVLNASKMKIHLPDCSSVSAMSEKNKVYTNKTKEELISEGYEPCGSCKP